MPYKFIYTLNILDLKSDVNEKEIYNQYIDNKIDL
jgi:hypothetical protein